MSLMHIILALACFGLGYAIAGGSTISPIYIISLILGAIGISLIARYFSSKKDK